MTVKFAHINLVSKDWKRLSKFYQEVFGCIPVPPERGLSGEWLDRAVGIKNAQIKGIHLKLPGDNEEGPTLEIFEYGSMPEHPDIKAHTPGFSHIAFAVDDVELTAKRIFQLGGSPVGELTVRDIPNVGRLTFQYVKDPEGNIIEIQNWIKQQ